MKFDFLIFFVIIIIEYTKGKFIMKFQLINPINPDYSIIEQILTNRGIDKEQIGHYLNTTDEDINPP